jgi:integrase
MFRRHQYQYGCIERKKRKKGPDVLVLRYRETKADGSVNLRSRFIGTVAQYPTKAEAKRAAEGMLLSINANNPGAHFATLGGLIDRYIMEELPERNSTRSRYLSWLTNHIRPKWGEFLIPKVKPMAVEQWLKGLNLAPKSRAHVRSLMGNLFNCAMRWELVEINDNPMRLVRVKDSSKRQREPRPLTVEEFSRLLPLLPEPFRTMSIVAMCLGLRVSEVLGLQWGDFDFTKMQVFIQRSWVYGEAGDVKTRYSNKWMPLDPALKNVIEEHGIRAASQSRGTDWVFANPQTGMPWWPSRIVEHWLRPAGIKAGIGRVGWHTFRHSYSTLLRSLEVDVKVQQELLRHADIRTTMNIYTQAVPEALREANSKVVRMVLPVTKTA